MASGTAMGTGALVITGALFAGPVDASCPDMIACYDVAGRVETCETLRRDGERFVSLTITQPTASQASCGMPWMEPAPASKIAERIASLEDQRYFFVRGHDASCDELLGNVLEAGVVELCCDTPPHTGECTLGGTLLIPKSPPSP